MVTFVLPTLTSICSFWLGSSQAPKYALVPWFLPGLHDYLSCLPNLLVAVLPLSFAGSSSSFWSFWRGRAPKSILDPRFVPLLRNITQFPDLNPIWVRLLSTSFSKTSNWHIKLPILHPHLDISEHIQNGNVSNFQFKAILSSYWQLLSFFGLLHPISQDTLTALPSKGCPLRTFDHTLRATLILHLSLKGLLTGPPALCPSLMYNKTEDSLKA